MKVTKMFDWTTPRGAKVSATLTKEHIEKEMVDADGWKIEVESNHVYRLAEKVTVNGKETNLHDLWNEAGVDCILVDRKGKDRILVALPEEVKTWLYSPEGLPKIEAKEAEERKRQIEKLESEKVKAEKQMESGALPTEAEIKRKAVEYNNVHNEGGYGYVPHYYSQEEYTRICVELDKLRQM